MEESHDSPRLFRKDYDIFLTNSEANLLSFVVGLRRAALQRKVHYKCLNNHRNTNANGLEPSKSPLVIINNGY